MLLVIDGLNARTSSVNTDRESVLGKEGFVTINNNEKRLVEICQENNWLLEKVYFNKKISIK